MGRSRVTCCDTPWRLTDGPLAAGRPLYDVLGVPPSCAAGQCPRPGGTEKAAGAPQVYLILELLLGGELLDAVMAKGSYCEADARLCFVQLLRGVHYLHSRRASPVSGALPRCSTVPSATHRAWVAGGDSMSK